MAANIILVFIVSLLIHLSCSHKNEEKKPVQYRLRQIIMEPVVSAEHEAEIRAKAEICLKKAMSGEDFTTLARTYSQEPGAQQSGGDLGFIESNNTVKTFSEAVFAMKPGEIRGLVKTQYGFHIIKLLEIKGDKRHAQHILFALNPGRSDSLAVFNKLTEIHKQLLNGKDFLTVFRQYNTNDMLGETDGYMVWQKPENMLASFSNEVQGLKSGDISKPFVSILGFHIILVDSINYDSDHLLEGFPVHIEEKLKKK